MKAVEQGPGFSSASVALAKKLVVESSATVTASPGEANCAAVPVATGKPSQSGSEKSSTVVPASAPPRIDGVLTFDGVAGSLPSNVGAEGSGSAVDTSRVVPSSLS